MMRLHIRVCVKLTQSLSSIFYVYDGLVREQLSSFHLLSFFVLIVEND